MHFRTARLAKLRRPPTLTNVRERLWGPSGHSMKAFFFSVLNLPPFSNLQLLPQPGVISTRRQTYNIIYPFVVGWKSLLADLPTPTARTLGG